jgi:hypothetical protein
MSGAERTVYRSFAGISAIPVEYSLTICFAELRFEENQPHERTVVE